MYYKAKLKKNRIDLYEIETPDHDLGQFDITIKFKKKDFYDCFPSKKFGEGDIKKSSMRSDFVHNLIMETLYDYFGMPQIVCHGCGSDAKNQLSEFKHERKFLHDRNLIVRKYFFDNSFQIRFMEGGRMIYSIRMGCKD